LNCVEAANACLDDCSWVIPFPFGDPFALALRAAGYVICMGECALDQDTCVAACLNTYLRCQANLNTVEALGGNMTATAYVEASKDLAHREGLWVGRGWFLTVMQGEALVPTMFSALRHSELFDKVPVDQQRRVLKGHKTWSDRLVSISSALEEHVLDVVMRASVDRADAIAHGTRVSPQVSYKDLTPASLEGDHPATQTGLSAAQQPLRGMVIASLNDNLRKLDESERFVTSIGVEDRFGEAIRGWRTDTKQVLKGLRST
jgi:hypothetical protein